ncbi:antitoxin Xre/MbcA/ParS toxin-binding domain-containing protein [Methylophilus sp. 3sh_L]|uniref:antitoxin Xre/MbcA/ParS toxin-binding domain-containing protein n=1 Tax=Methylophilus sp. 3sh_L TaxID=3377114 RepID=UPI00398F07AE
MRISIDRELLEKAVSAFGAEHVAINWLLETHSLLGTSPAEFAKTQTGRIEVEKILSAIQFGGIV